MRLYHIIFILALISNTFSFPTEGGNITNIDINSSQNSSHWAGIYGDILVNNSPNAQINPSKNSLKRVDVNYSLPAGCIATLYGVIASNSTINLPLIPGNLTILDNQINSSENGSLTFTNYSNLTTSFGNISNVPYTITNPPSSGFRTYYLNDQAGNIVFFSTISTNSIDWSSTTSDYQMILLAGQLYNISIDYDLNCNTTTINNKKHSLYIRKINTVYAFVGERVDIPVIVENDGDYSEVDVYLKANYPSINFFAFYPKLSKGEAKTAILSITPPSIGVFTVKITAYSDDARYIREFTLIVKEKKECNNDMDCGDGFYCSNSICIEKEDYCASNSDCLSSQRCENNVCVDIVCECGEIRNNSCIPYECCSDIDCGEGKACFSNKCIEIKPNIEYNETPIIGKNVSAFVYDQNGKPFEGYLIADGKVYEIKNGRVEFVVPKDLLIYITKGNRKYGFFIPAKKLARIVLSPFPVIINMTTYGKVVDENGDAIGKTRVELYEGGEVIKVFYTEEDSSFIFVVDEKKEYLLKAYSEEYYVEPLKFNPISYEQVCYLPIILFILLLIITIYWYIKRRRISTGIS